MVVSSNSGDWSGNLYDFFFRVYPRITSDLSVPFIAKGMDRVDETVLHLALREVLLNICAHADHYGRQGIVIVKNVTSMTFTNPGDIRIGLKAALSGGISDPRNVTIMKMFGLVDIGERAGSGIPDFINTWQKYVGLDPEYEISHNPDRTKLTIPYTIAALQRAGSKLVGQTAGSVQVTNSETTRTNSEATNINDRAKIKSFINDKLDNCKNINDKFSITDDVVDKLVDIYCYLESCQSSKGDAIANLIGMSMSRTREYLQALIALDIVVPEGGNKNRTYRLL